MSAPHSRAAAGATRHALGALAIGLMVAAPAQANVSFTWDPSAIGLTGSAFSADALKATEVSHISFTDAFGNWAEHGYAKITGVLNNNVLSVPTGLNSTYTLYLDFSGTGNVGVGQFFTATETLYMVNGVSTFGINGNNDAFVDNGVNTAIALATSTLIQGTTGQVGNDLFANLWTTFAPTANGALVFNQPQPFPNIFYGNFYHSASEPGGVTPIFVGGNPNPVGFVLNGGDDTLSFIPEPISLLLFAGGLPGVWFFRRKTPPAA